MKSTLDVVDILWSYINSSTLKTTITGKIYKNNRPVNSKTEDIVINSLPMNNDRLQEGVMNVNIYIPNKAQQLNGVEDRTIADHARLKALATQAIGILDNKFVTAGEGDGGYGFDVQQQVLIQDDTTKEWYINIRLRFYNIN